MKLSQSGPSASTGTLSMLYLSDEAHSGLDNVAFLSRDLVTFCEDAGDALHAQRNALDSAYVWNATGDYSQGRQPLRWLAEGRDASATLDAANGGFGSNEGDNEITGPCLRRRQRHRRDPWAPTSLISAAGSGVGSTPSSTATTAPTRSLSSTGARGFANPS